MNNEVSLRANRHIINLIFSKEEFDSLTPESEKKRGFFIQLISSMNFLTFQF